jgi:DNA-binding transcriptional LysR family regulator
LPPGFRHHSEKRDGARIEVGLARCRQLRGARARRAREGEGEALAAAGARSAAACDADTDGQFTSGLREIAKALEAPLAPALACQSFPQTMAALRSGCFWAIVPELAVRELPSGVVHRVSDTLLQRLDREAMLAWNPRVIRVRPNAAKIAARLQQVLAI